MDDIVASAVIRGGAAAPPIQRAWEIVQGVEETAKLMSREACETPLAAAENAFARFVAEFERSDFELDSGVLPLAYVLLMARVKYGRLKLCSSQKQGKGFSATQNTKTHDNNLSTVSDVINSHSAAKNNSFVVVPIKTRWNDGQMSKLNHHLRGSHNVTLIVLDAEQAAWPALCAQVSRLILVTSSSAVRLYNAIDSKAEQLPLRASLDTPLTSLVDEFRRTSVSESSLAMQTGYMAMDDAKDGETRFVRQRTREFVSDTTDASLRMHTVAILGTSNKFGQLDPEKYSAYPLVSEFMQTAGLGWQRNSARFELPGVRCVQWQRASASKSKTIVDYNRFGAIRPLFNIKNELQLWRAMAFKVLPVVRRLGGAGALLQYAFRNSDYAHASIRRAKLIAQLYNASGQPDIVRGDVFQGGELLHMHQSSASACVDIVWSLMDPIHAARVGKRALSTLTQSSLFKPWGLLRSENERSGTFMNKTARVFDAVRLFRSVYSHSATRLLLYVYVFHANGTRFTISELRGEGKEGSVAAALDHAVGPSLLHNSETHTPTTAEMVSMIQIMSLVTFNDPSTVRDIGDVPAEIVGAMIDSHESDDEPLQQAQAQAQISEGSDPGPTADEIEAWLTDWHPALNQVNTDAAAQQCDLFGNVGVKPDPDKIMPMDSSAAPAQAKSDDDDPVVHERLPVTNKNKKKRKRVFAEAAGIAGIDADSSGSQASAKAEDDKNIKRAKKKRTGGGGSSFTGENQPENKSADLFAVVMKFDDVYTKHGSNDQETERQYYMAANLKEFANFALKAIAMSADAKTRQRLFWRFALVNVYDHTEMAAEKEMDAAANKHVPGLIDPILRVVLELDGAAEQVEMLSQSREVMFDMLTMGMQGKLPFGTMDDSMKLYLAWSISKDVFHAGNDEARYEMLTKAGVTNLSYEMLTHLAKLMRKQYYQLHEDVLDAGFPVAVNRTDVERSVASELARTQHRLNRVFPRDAGTHPKKFLAAVSAFARHVIADIKRDKYAYAELSRSDASSAVREVGQNPDLIANLNMILSGARDYSGLPEFGTFRASLGHASGNAHKKASAQDVLADELLQWAQQMYNLRATATQLVDQQAGEWTSLESKKLARAVSNERIGAIVQANGIWLADDDPDGDVSPEAFVDRLLGDRLMGDDEKKAEHESAVYMREMIAKVDYDLAAFGVNSPVKATKRVRVARITGPGRNRLARRAGPNVILWAKDISDSGIDQADKAFLKDVVQYYWSAKRTRPDPIAPSYASDVFVLWFSANSREADRRLLAMSMDNFVAFLGERKSDENDTAEQINARGQEELTALLAGVSTHSLLSGYIRQAQRAKLAAMNQDMAFLNDRDVQMPFMMTVIRNQNTKNMRRAHRFEKGMLEEWAKWNAELMRDAFEFGWRYRVQDSGEQDPIAYYDAKLAALPLLTPETTELERRARQEAKRTRKRTAAKAHAIDAVARAEKAATEKKRLKGLAMFFETETGGNSSDNDFSDDDKSDSGDEDFDEFYTKDQASAGSSHDNDDGPAAMDMSADTVGPYEAEDSIIMFPCVEGFDLFFAAQLRFEHMRLSPHTPATIRNAYLRETKAIKLVDPVLYKLALKAIKEMAAGFQAAQKKGEPFSITSDARKLITEFVDAARDGGHAVSSCPFNPADSTALFARAEASLQSVNEMPNMITIATELAAIAAARDQDAEDEEARAALPVAMTDNDDDDDDGEGELKLDNNNAPARIDMFLMLGTSTRINHARLLLLYGQNAKDMMDLLQEWIRAIIEAENSIPANLPEQIASFRVARKSEDTDAMEIAGAYKIVIAEIGARTRAMTNAHARFKTHLNSHPHSKMRWTAAIGKSLLKREAKISNAIQKATKPSARAKKEAKKEKRAREAAAKKAEKASDAKAARMQSLSELIERVWDNNGREAYYAAFGLDNPDEETEFENDGDDLRLLMMIDINIYARVKKVHRPAARQIAVGNRSVGDAMKQIARRVAKGRSVLGREPKEWSDPLLIDPEWLLD